MQVHLLRHGTAEDVRPGGSDADRKLTEAGREEVRRALAAVHQSRIAASLILRRTYVRAVETAEIAAAAVGYAGSIIRTDALVPSESTQRVWDEIRSRPDESQILLTGHEPLISQVAAHLLNSPD